MDIERGRVLRWNLYLGGHLSTCTPVRVVESGPEGLLLWLAVGSPAWHAVLPPGAHLRDIPPEERPADGYPLRAGHWHRGNALIHQPADASHAVWWLFSSRDGSGGFSGWYVNLERHRRDADDIDVLDLELDVTVRPDRTWEWKDEESFAAKTGHPSYWTPREAEDIRAEGHRVARLAESGVFPFDGTWCDFTPPSSWALPELPLRPVSPMTTWQPRSRGQTVATSNRLRGQ
ncbi:DUF402 domain-containing protein [Streptomyces avermitilis]|uniref:DUF402 domain-containing protein n=1 Tax=Streptomyces avermitilis TaxID=33903 RepID=UPI00340E501D